MQGLCGPDGRLTRLRAYTAWYNKLKQFQDSCAAQGGTFSYQDPSFAEPQNESYCLQAVPEVGSSMFEEPLCNYRSSARRSPSSVTAPAANTPSQDSTISFWVLGGH